MPWAIQYQISNALDSVAFTCAFYPFRASYSVTYPNWLAVDNAPLPAIETLPSIPLCSSLMRSTSSPQPSTHLLPPGTRASDVARITSSQDFLGAGTAPSRIRHCISTTRVAISPAWRRVCVQQAQRASQLTHDNQSPSAAA